MRKDKAFAIKIFYICLLKFNTFSLKVSRITRFAESDVLILLTFYTISQLCLKVFFLLLRSQTKEKFSNIRCILSQLLAQVARM